MTYSQKNIQEFYEDYYSLNAFLTPAFLIYDQLRIDKIKYSLSKYYSSGKVLIIGCGSKKDSEFLDSIENSFGFDLSFNAIKKQKSKSRKVFVGDANYLPFKDDTFSIVIISEVIEHIPTISQVVREIFRIESPGGKIILSTPNWISFFGLFRWIAKIFLNKIITSDNQPYDDWKTKARLKKDFFPYFNLIESSGIWYLPPFQYRNKGFSPKITNTIYKIFSPIEKFLSSRFPDLGHLLFVIFITNK